jgi:hypothetical protein
MILKNVNIIGCEGMKNISVSGNRITKVTSNELKLNSDLCITFDNAIAFPGLINSHDHLEFNLFPQLGNSTYNNYTDWGPDIHAKNKDIIDAVLKIPKQLRAEWGAYKNLLNGITTVVQHGEYFNLKNSLINVFQNCYSLHSVQLEKFWKLKLNKPFVKNQPYVIHIGEGTDMTTFEEINELIKWNFFKRMLIGVHGVAMNIQQAKSFEALVWCPDSNFFLLNATAKVNELKSKTKILFGTDSTLSASWNIWEQLRLARNANMLTDTELYQSLTSVPASVWNLNAGIIEEGKIADIVVAKMKDENNLMNSFFSINPEDILLIVRNGEIVLFDEVLICHLNKNEVRKDFKIHINNIPKHLAGDLTGLIKQIKQNSEVLFPIDIE